MGSICKSLKIEKTIVYAVNNVLLNLTRLFELILVFQDGFGMYYIRVFCNFPG